MLLHSFKKHPLLQETLQPHQVADFCKQLQESNEILDLTSATELLNLFCNKCWQLDTLQQSCYESVAIILKRCPIDAQIKLVPLLIENSKTYNDLVFLAFEMVKSFTPSQCNRLDKIYVISWSYDDEFTIITEQEYKYRQQNNLKCWYHTHVSENGNFISYRRPFNINDIKCFEASLHIAHMSGQEIFFRTGR